MTSNRKASDHCPLKIIKYLPEYSWLPSVLTVDKDTFTRKDESLLNEISPDLRVSKSKREQLIASETIIAFGNDNNEVKEILEETNAGMILNYDNDAKEFFDHLEKIKTDLSKVKKFDRENISKDPANLLDKI